MLGVNRVYVEQHGSASWEGRQFADKTSFVRFLTTKVKERLDDAEAAFAEELKQLASTGMERKNLADLLKKQPRPLGWEIGESLAECALVDDVPGNVVWPWNNERDKRTPLASLPGADLIGFLEDGPNAWLLIGEVKTSTDLSCPPGVMTGRKGMTWQLLNGVKDLSILWSVLKWLQARCTGPQMRDRFQAAAKRCLTSGYRDVVVVGALVRDTVANPKDLKSRGEELAEHLPTPTRVLLFAWYLPVAIADLPKLMGGGP